MPKKIEVSEDNKINEMEFKRRIAEFNFKNLTNIKTRKLNNSLFNYTSGIRKYKKEDINKFLEMPKKYEKHLREISTYYYNASQHYRRIVDYLAKLATFDYIVEPYGFDIDKINDKSFKIAYKKNVDLLDVLNLKHEFSKIMLELFKEDIFYGYEYEEKDSYYIQKLDPLYCQISSIEDGCYNFAFDFTYFDLYPEKLSIFALEFQQKYDIYKQNRLLSRWQELESQKTICIKLNESNLDYSIPYFAGIFESIIDIEDYKALKKAKSELQNYKLLSLQLPIRKDSEVNNDFSIELDMMLEFYNKMLTALPDGVGLVLSPTELKDYTFDNQKVDADGVHEAEQQMFNSAGISQLLFNSEKGTGASLSMNLTTDGEIIFTLLRQFERWVNRKLKAVNMGNIKFRIRFLDVTVFTRQDLFDNLIVASQYGLPVKMQLCSLLGMSPSSVSNLCYLENDILQLDKKFIPLMSSHTLSGNNGTNDNGGGNTKSKSKLSDEGIKSQENDTNNKKSRKV